MTYQFPPDIQQRLNEHLSGGRFLNEDDVLREAMDALDQLELDKRTRWEERNRIAIEQSRKGLSKPLSDEAVLVRLRQRLAEEGIEVMRVVDAVRDLPGQISSD